MTVIADLSSQPSGSVVKGIFIVTRIRNRAQSTHRPSSYVTLRDNSGELGVYCWNNEIPSNVLVPGKTIDAELSLLHLDGQLKATLTRAVPVTFEDANPFRYVPLSAIPRPDLVARLEDLIDGIHFPVIQSFLKDVFSEDPLTIPFLQLPASRNHHHSWPGGLAEHSLEVAELAYQASYLDHDHERYLALAAGLLHDIGKVWMSRSSGSKRAVPYIVRHDDLTLEILGPAFDKIDQRWPDGGSALRYLLQWRKRPGETRPLLPVAMAVRFADQYSAASSARRIADKQRMPWERYARLDAAGPSSRFWYPSRPKDRSFQ